MSDDSTGAQRSLSQTLKGYGRGLVGGLLFALAPLYTSEVWWQSFIAEPRVLIVATLVTFGLLVAYAHYAGIHDTDSLGEEVLEALEIFFLGFVVGAVVLKLLGQLPPSLSLEVTVNRIVLEGLISSIGVAVGSTQLGQNPDDGGGSSGGTDKRGLVHEFAYSGLGAILIVSGFATTMEIVVIALEAPPWAVVVTAMLSFALALGVMSYFDFKGSERMEGGCIYAGGPLGDAAVTYAIGIVVSIGLLWGVGRFDGTGLAPSLFMIVYLALPATIGAAVGRLIL
ncbi:DUF2391 family protein [Rubrivirga sp. IMCC43871]|uniref:DUF2391 family protein n=1 Tax=Rubrivirga sp. IMCC43871 TaxID=3391575 RepID=UPI00398FBD4F